MSAQQVHSLDIRRAAPPKMALLLAGTPEDRALEWDFLMFRAFLDNPDADSGLHDGVLAVVIPQDDPAVANLNLEAARAAVRRGEPVVYRYLDSAGRPLDGTEYRFTIDVSDATWGTEPHPTLDGKSATELRAWFQGILAGSQHGEAVKIAYESIVVLNGVRVYLLDEPERGIYACLAFERAAF